MRTLPSLVLGLCSVGAGVGLSLAAQPSPSQAHATPPPVIATALPLSTVSIDHSPAQPRMRRQAVDGAPCQPAQQGQLASDHGATVTCRSTPAGLRWALVGA